MKKYFLKVISSIYLIVLLMGSCFYAIGNETELDKDVFVVIFIEVSRKYLKRLTVGESVTNVYDNLFNFIDLFEELESIDVAKGNKHYNSQDGLIYDIGIKQLIACPRAKTGPLLIPDSVESINVEAFQKCQCACNSINIPPCVKTLIKFKINSSEYRYALSDNMVSTEKKILQNSSNCGDLSMKKSAELSSSSSVFDERVSEDSGALESLTYPKGSPVKEPVDKNEIVCLIGESGSGKTTMQQYLVNELKYKAVDSYTTRPRRSEGEIGHKFVDLNNKFDLSSLPTIRRPIAFITYFSNNWYWVFKDQLCGQKIVMAVNPYAVENLESNVLLSTEGFNIYTVYLLADKRERISRQIDRVDDSKKSPNEIEQMVKNRMKREREEYSWSMCDCVVRTSESFDKTKKSVESALNAIKIKRLKYLKR